jgi:choline dehydrogenase-like flavoprotein
MPGFGAEHFEMMKNYRKIAGFGVMLIDTPSDHNRVTSAESGKGSIIQYALSQPDQERLRFAAEKAVQVMLAAGANVAMLPTEQRLGPLERARFDKPDQARHCAQLGLEPFQTTITSAHIQSTLKMGELPERTMVNSRCESRYVRNLMVCDSSVFPTSCGANPMISIMTLAQYQARRIAAEWNRYET